MINETNEGNVMPATIKQKVAPMPPVVPPTRGVLPPPTEFAGMGGSYSQDPETGRITRNED